MDAFFIRSYFPLSAVSFAGSAKGCRFNRG
jgi:hypothetical protein